MLLFKTIIKGSYDDKMEIKKYDPKERTDMRW